tara:strand:+ start:460 stop:837 length:378 start_codon:yes stop_codon:yes gene_type:complete
MKKLIIAIILCTLSFSKDWLANHQNPNGKPFTLTFGMNWEQWDRIRYTNDEKEYYTTDDGRIDITLPIHSLLTLKWSYFLDRGYTTYKTGTTSDGHSYHLPTSKNNRITSLGGELHLPIYKLWEK